MNKVIGSLGLIATLALAATNMGCTRTETAHALYPMVDEDTPAVWVFMKTNKERTTGIYRCSDNGGRVQCMRAALTSQ